MNVLKEKYKDSLQGFDYFSILPVLHYLQAVLFIKIGTIFMIYYTTLFIIRRYQRPGHIFLFFRYDLFVD
jgi:hypothetical protein